MNGPQERIGSIARQLAADYKRGAFPHNCAMAILEELRHLSPSAETLRHPGEPGYHDGDGPCPVCGEPGEGYGCNCCYKE